MITIEPTLLAVLTGALLPVLLGFVMRARWSQGTKGNITLAVSLVVAWLGNQTNEWGYASFSWQMLAVAAITWATAIAAYNGYWKPVAHVNDFPDVIRV